MKWAFVATHLDALLGEDRVFKLASGFRFKSIRLKQANGSWIMEEEKNK